MFMQKDGYGPQLYVKNVQIMDHCADLLPEYLRFVKGVVDSSDLPLNVSREMLQDDSVIQRIRKSLVSKILSTLKSLKEKRPEDYKKFYAAFGKILKEGAHFDFENKDKLVDLLLFPSTATEGDELATLRDYRDRMPEEQKEIYFLTGDDLNILRDTPYLEAFKKKGYEVLFMADPIDEWVVQSVTQYDDIPLKAIDKGEINLEGDENQEERDEEKKNFAGLMDHMKDVLSDDLSDVRLSRRLSDSACCLVHDEQGMNANMERIMRAMNQEVPTSKKILELNPDHELVKKMNTLAGADEHKDQLQSFVDLLYGQAQLTSGAEVKNPGHFSQLVSDLMLKASE
jgi:molecular chaperone HtpG